QQRCWDLLRIPVILIRLLLGLVPRRQPTQPDRHRRVIVGWRRAPRGPTAVLGPASYSSDFDTPVAGPRSSAPAYAARSAPAGNRRSAPSTGRPNSGVGTCFVFQ